MSTYPEAITFMGKSLPRVESTEPEVAIYERGCVLVRFGYASDGKARAWLHLTEGPGCFVNWTTGDDPEEALQLLAHGFSDWLETRQTQVELVQRWMAK